MNYYDIVCYARNISPHLDEVLDHESVDLGHGGHRALATGGLLGLLRLESRLSLQEQKYCVGNSSISQIKCFFFTDFKKLRTTNTQIPSTYFNTHFHG